MHRIFGHAAHAAFKSTAAIATAVVTLALLFGATGPAHAQDAKSPSPTMGPLEPYLMPSQAAEVALARSAAPPSVAGEAEVLALGRHGYETAVKGTNGFVCYVQRSWAADFETPDFWNPRVRGPICLNAVSVRSILPPYLELTRWVLAGASKADLIERTKAALAAHQIPAPEIGAMSFMMSKDGYLGDAAGGPWRPHVMFFMPRTDASEWGANLHGAPVMSASYSVVPITLFFVPVQKWSDGTPVPMGK
ncbi:MAG TPA: hypothetical protein VII73_00330 [Caulobacteraceae bacterium]